MKKIFSIDSNILSGGLLALAISLSVLLLLEFLYPIEARKPNLALNLFEGLGVYLIAGASAGFLTTRKLKENHVITSIKSTLVGFLINVLLMFFMQTLFGLTWVFTGYIIGGAIGGILAKFYFNTKNRTSFVNSFCI